MSVWLLLYYAPRLVSVCCKINGCIKRAGCLWGTSGGTSDLCVLSWSETFPLELGRGTQSSLCMHEFFRFITTLPCLSEKPGLDSKGWGVIYIKMEFINQIWSKIILKNECVLQIFSKLILLLILALNALSYTQRNDNMEFNCNVISRNCYKDSSLAIVRGWLTLISNYMYTKFESDSY